VIGVDKINEGLYLIITTKLCVIGVDKINKHDNCDLLIVLKFKTHFKIIREGNTISLL
jgi:hypothetical protein